MANSSIKTVSIIKNRLLLALSILLIIAGIAGFYLLEMHNWYVRSLVLVIGIATGIAVELSSTLGKSFIAFSKDSYREINKVVWPSRKEAVQTTMVVFGFVLLMAIYLWISDKTIEWVIFSLILGWK
ncbi:preprotein translocase subunit SecE [Candidatus Vallotia tarda]|uniref:Protein translocase subunit SecE n=1 Tax=Candidatus Vallotiella hemipterorum TaxID=1177213 RepID=A0A916JXD3_9BURK|nr:preprotein translocase subunit SecE [Candidatus Vallotia tarda]CAG7603878.1 Protein translocase subunit SecE [Candidatus Vallotia tarda]